MEILTKDNFWDRMKEQYPKAMDKFLKYIDQYKIDNNWDSLFQGDKTLGEHTYYKTEPSPKFHELPVAMQIGIFDQWQSSLETTEEAAFYNIQVFIEETLELEERNGG